jgi:hypothetical protein
LIRFVFGFRKSNRQLRLAPRASATGAARGVSICNGRNHKGVNEQYGSAQDEQDSVHGIFSLLGKLDRDIFMSAPWAVKSL